MAGEILNRTSASGYSSRHKRKSESNRLNLLLKDSWAMQRFATTGKTLRTSVVPICFQSTFLGAIDLDDDSVLNDNVDRAEA
jgi:hypothetical protein